jgi:hypothetical protein
MIGCFIAIAFSFRLLVSVQTSTTVGINMYTDEIPFPAVTLCNVSPRLTFADRFIHDLLDIKTYDEYYNIVKNSSTGSQLNLEKIESVCLKRNENELTKLNQGIWSHIISRGATFEYISECNFVRNFGDEFDCKRSFRPVLTPVGKCYTFNDIADGKNGVIVKRKGQEFGLQLRLFTDDNDYKDSRGNLGLQVVVHERYSIPDPNSYGIGIPPGRDALVKASKFIHEDKSQTSGCSYDEKLNFYEGYTYTREACWQDKLLEHFAMYCGCVISPTRPSSGPYVDIRTCTFNDSCCLIVEHVRFRNSSSNKDCPLPCYNTKYITEVSFLSFPTDNWIVNELFDIAPNLTKEEFMYVKVYMDDVVTSTTTEVSYTLLSFIADTGGHTGLFLGISVISVLEIIMLMLDQLKGICFTKKVKQKIKEVDAQLILPDIKSNDDDDVKKHDNNEHI